MNDLQQLKRTARLTGLAYLGLAAAGAVGFMAVRTKLYVPDDALATLTNLGEHQALARLGVAADLSVVLAQALAAVLFFKLFGGFDSLAAGALAAFGLVNSVAVLVGTVFSATALGVALDAASPAATRATTVQLLYQLNGAAWSTGGLFFGLWLMPMGWLAWRSGWMPRVLGWILMVGGVGYILSAYTAYVLPGLPGVTLALPLPATVGEFWMVGYLLVRGVAPGADPSTSISSVALRS